MQRPLSVQGRTCGRERQSSAPPLSGVRRLDGVAAWRLTGRFLLGLAPVAGGVGSASLGANLAVVVAVAAYGALTVLRVLRKLPWLVILGADLVVLGLGQWHLAADGQLAIAVLTPVLLATVAAYECGLETGGRVGAAAVAIMAALQVLGPGPEPTGRSVVAVAAAVAVTGWAATIGVVSRRAEETLATERQSLEALKEQVVTTVSHELRTPLTIIQGLTSTLVSRWDVLPETRRLDLIDSLGVNIASLDASVLHFLDAGRLSRGGWQVRPQPVEIGPLLDKVLVKLEPILAGHDVQRRLECDTVWADPEALSRSIELLLVNACRFSPPAGSISLRVVGSPDTGWELTVSDRGQGISPNDLPKVFDRLWRGDVTETGVSRGAGLGLAIVKELAERHGGTVSATSTKGRGSTFRISLPKPSVEGSVLFDERPPAESPPA